MPTHVGIVAAGGLPQCAIALIVFRILSGIHITRPSLFILMLPLLFRPRVVTM
jgi:hypothetical protein